MKKEKNCSIVLLDVYKLNTYNINSITYFSKIQTYLIHLCLINTCVDASSNKGNRSYDEKLRGKQ